MRAFLRKLRSVTRRNMMKLVYAQSAKNDIAEITGYFLPLNEQAADSIYYSILDAAEKISEFPRIGRSRPDLGAGIYSFPTGRYFIVYTIIDGSIVVMRVLDARRDISAIFSEED